MMPNIRRFGPLAIVVAVAMYAAALAAAGPAKAIKWQSSFKKAQQIAAKQKKVLMVDFYADW